MSWCIVLLMLRDSVKDVTTKDSSDILYLLLFGSPARNYVFLKSCEMPLSTEATISCANKYGLNRNMFILHGKKQSWPDLKRSHCPDKSHDLK